jgi:CelD/BcsL family acetyltransferase involved in cellulose biosynthesis
VVVTEVESGEVAMALPLVVAREGLLRVASFADLGVSDYGAPLLGRLIDCDKPQIRRLWRSVRAAMRDVDLIRLERMPAKIGDRENSLLRLFGCGPARDVGHELVLAGNFDEYLQGLGKRYRKDLERCHRLWEKEGAPRFYRATSSDEIARVFSVMEEQQANWQAAHHVVHRHDLPGFSPFYERIALDGSDAGLTALFALEANEEIIATLLGLAHAETFTLLRISTGGERWSDLSPGRLVVLEAVKTLAANGVRRFDMGCRSNPLKHGFGTQEVPLYDLVIAQDVTALPTVVAHEVVAHLRARRRLRSVLGKAVPRLAG